ncbi:MAG TPA: PQQ-binding-like beta-propeller repeat protein [Bryobacteraceae bacterium]|nr:PQQ-binding-like beta-propeller repeat protein [Bryobacteraceae bacterium]
MMRAGFLLLLAANCAFAQIQYSDILKSPAENWLTYHGDYSGQRHSPLTQINRDTVRNLVPKWTYHFGGAARLESTPVVADGVMYVTNTNEVDAIDARTGRQIWSYTDDRARRSDVNRGVAILGNAVFFVTADGYLVSLNRTTGGILWHKQYADVKKGYYATLAPLALKDRILLGVSGGDSGMRGFVAAYSPSTGEELWKFYTVPLKGEPGAETWGEFDPQWGGGATWMTGTYDPELNITYWMTGNPWPDYYGGGRRGANLYTDSVVALDADTGKLKWYFQFTPHDTHDWDAESIPVLVDALYRGKPRKLLIDANRNGFLYVLDRVTGQYLEGHPFVKLLSWATGIDASGHPIEVRDMEPTAAGRVVCPSSRGATNWMSPSWDPVNKLLFVPALEQCDQYVSSMRTPEPMHGSMAGGGGPVNGQTGKFYLRALDPFTGATRWEYGMTGLADMWAGSVTSAGGLVFFGDDQGQLVALNTATGADLWHYNTGQLLTASPMTYSVRGKQFVAIASATDVFAFGLFEPAKPSTTPKELRIGGSSITAHDRGRPSAGRAGKPSTTQEPAGKNTPGIQN